MKKTIGKVLTALLATTIFFSACSGGGDNPASPFQPVTIDGITISPTDTLKTDSQLVSEANTELSNGNYQQAIDKFRVAYAKNPNDENKIYYALTELAALSVDETIVDIIRNKLGAKSYPATMGALLNSAWAKDKKQSVLGSGWTKSYQKSKSYPLMEFVQDDNGPYIRASGQPTNSPSSENRYIQGILYDGEWWPYFFYMDIKKEYSGFYLTNVTPDKNGQYIVLRDSSKDASVPTDCRFNMPNIIKRKNVGGSDSFTLPELAVPSWVTSLDSYKSTLIGTTLSAESVGYLLYANIISNNENGLNDTVDKLLFAIHKKSEFIKGIVDTLGNGTAKLEASFIKSLNLQEFLGEDALEISKTEMNALVSALECVDAILHYISAYDLSANLKAAETESGTKQNTLKTIKNCVTAQTLASRDPEKISAAKTLALDALSRVISSYTNIKTSTRYPQVIKDNVSKYGDIFYDGAVKAKAAIENGSVFYIPKTLDGTAFPSDLASAAFGIDMGKVFTPGYFTKFFERSADLKTIKFYYKRFEQAVTYGSSFSMNNTESELTEITDVDTFFNTTLNDAGWTLNYNGNGTIGSTTSVWYKVGMLINYGILSSVLPSAQNIAEQYKFIDFIEIRSK